MSRDSSPATLIGKLAIDGSLGTSNTGMPVTTRGMHQRRRNLAASQQASVGTAASSSRVPPPSRDRREARASSRRSVRPPPSQRGTARQARDDGPSDDDGDDGDDESEHGDPPEEENHDRIINEIMSTFADDYPVPSEFANIDSRGTTMSAQSQDCRRLARLLSASANREPQLLPSMRHQFSRVYCATRLVNNLRYRHEAIKHNLLDNLNNQTLGRDVPNSIDDWRHLNAAIETVLTDYRDVLTDEQGRALAWLLVEILGEVISGDQDLYFGRPIRTAFAGESSDGNLFRRFLSPRGHPIDFLGPLLRLDVNLLAGQRARLSNIMTTFQDRERRESDAEQYDRVEQALGSIWTRL